jgi:hypothetical protein
VRLRTVENHEGGPLPSTGTIYHQDFDCAKRMYRVTAMFRELVDGSVRQVVFPPSADAPRLNQWKRPIDGWREDVMLREVCALALFRSMAAPRLPEAGSAVP